MSLVNVRTHLKHLAETTKPLAPIFFKTHAGGYAEHDRFLGLRVPDLRTCLKLFPQLSMPDIEELLVSPFNEERLLALLFMVKRYATNPHEIYSLYRQNMPYVNNWNLVDASAHSIVGAYTWQHQNLEILKNLAGSTTMWERRIAMVATWHTISQGDVDWATCIAQHLLKDSHDLIHKATGWMLREMGKKNLPALISFLDQHGSDMPRTMLRYAIEKLTAEQRQYYIKL